jgi:hypothetical protein
VNINMNLLNELARLGETSFACSKIFHTLAEMLHHGHIDGAIKEAETGSCRSALKTQIRPKLLTNERNTTMTAHTHLVAITPTANAKSVAVVAGTNLPQLMTLADQRITELKILLKQIIALHPSSGGDASNYSALQAVLAELA